MILISMPWNIPFCQIITEAPWCQQDWSPATLCEFPECPRELRTTVRGESAPWQKDRCWKLQYSHAHWFWKDLYNPTGSFLHLELFWPNGKLWGNKPHQVPWCSYGFKKKHCYYCNKVDTNQYSVNCLLSNETWMVLQNMQDLNPDPAIQTG